jgi:HlyD family secretion protein
VTGANDPSPRALVWQPPLVPPTPIPRMRGVIRVGNMLLFGFLGILGIWSAFAPLESAAIAPGLVEAESSRKVIQHLEGGIIK